MAPEEDPEDSSSGIADKPLSPRQFALELARDVLLAVLVVGIALGALFAYSGVWPPMVVVESGSMQHSNTASHLGVIDTGDLVLVQAVNSEPGRVTTYVQGRATGYETYSNYGDVIVFHPPGAPAYVTPTIHRAILYLEYPSALGFGVDIPSLAPSSGFPASEWRGTDWNNNPTTSPFNLRNLVIQVQSWDTGSSSMLPLTFNFTGVTNSGFLTKGDNNRIAEGLPPVPASSIIGTARGELPWFGLIKLTIWPTSTGCCPFGWGSTGNKGAPKNSWDSLTTSLILVPLGIFLADYGFAFGEREWQRRRDRRNGARDKEPPAEDAEPPPDNPT